jgi:sialic acid synthase SpsE
MMFIDKLLNIKADHKVYIIAEVGSNWKTHEDLVNSVQMAKAAGANAVKFQFFTKDELYGPTYKLDDTFPLQRLAERAKFVGIDFLCSAFSPEGVARVDPFVEAHKVASSEMSHVRILDAVRKTGKPCLLSTGAFHVEDIQKSINFFGNYSVIPLHCNISYPTKLTDLKKLTRMMNHRIAGHGKVWGYSDHTTSIDAVPAFMCGVLGASVYEKHFNPFDFTDTPDAPHALNQKEFTIMCSYLNGRPVDGTEEEQARLMHIRRVIATQDLKEGDVLKEGVNIGIFRSKKPDVNGVSPFAIKALEGKLVNRDIPQGDGVSTRDIT